MPHNHNHTITQPHNHTQPHTHTHTHPPTHTGRSLCRLPLGQVPWFCPQGESRKHVCQGKMGAKWLWAAQKMAPAASHAQFHSGPQNNFLIPLIWAVETWQWLGKTRNFRKSTSGKLIFVLKKGPVWAKIANLGPSVIQVPLGDTRADFVPSTTLTQIFENATNLMDLSKKAEIWLPVSRDEP